MEVTWTMTMGGYLTAPRQAWIYGVWYSEDLRGRYTVNPSIDTPENGTYRGINCVRS